MIEIRVAGPDSWPDVEAVLGPGGGYGGCWCTFWRLTNQVIHERTPAENKVQLENLVIVGDPVGLVLYVDGRPAGWIQVASRPSFPRLWHTKGLSMDDPADDAVWSIVCIFLTAAARGAGHADRLVAAAVDFARDHGARRVEGYPITEAGTNRRSQLSSGTVGLFTRAGFTAVTPPSGRRVVMNRIL